MTDAGSPTIPLRDEVRQLGAALAQSALGLAELEGWRGRLGALEPGEKAEAVAQLIAFGVRLEAAGGAQCRRALAQLMWLVVSLSGEAEAQDLFSKARSQSASTEPGAPVPQASDDKLWK